MYQALYRKWRPRTFDDVVGQEHITDTLKRQVATQRLSHAYLFTGTRGTGKTSCAKIMARAVNCENPQNGNPCNCCKACKGIEDGSILEVIELDAASNNGIDDVRTLQDEAIYSPASIRKRVYIIDEVHMMSNQAFNALLKIIEEPPEHLMFILATTELHKVPATIKSRCQQFAFKRILPENISSRLRYVAEQESINLTENGAALLARLADGGLRDALTLLDQCNQPGSIIDENAILTCLGLCGNTEILSLVTCAGQSDITGALSVVNKLYSDGKDVATMLDETAGLCRDLLLIKSVPNCATSLLSGNFDSHDILPLAELFTSARLIQMLNLVQSTLSELPRSTSKKRESELCVIRLCDPSLDSSNDALLARISKLEALIDGTASELQRLGKQNNTAVRPTVPNSEHNKPVGNTSPPWEVESVPQSTNSQSPTAASKARSESPKSDSLRPQRPTRSQGAPPSSSPSNGFWSSFVPGLKGKVSAMVYPWLTKKEVDAVFLNGVLTIYASGMAYDMIKISEWEDGVKQAASIRFGMPVSVVLKQGKIPENEAFTPAPRSTAQTAENRGSLDDLVAFGQEFDTIEIN